MLRKAPWPEPGYARARPTDVTVQQRRRLTAVTAVLLLLTAGLISLSLSAAIPATGRSLTTSTQHHLMLPSPVRTLSSHTNAAAADVALLGPGLLLGLALLVWIRRRPEGWPLVAAQARRSSARAPPRGRR